MTALASYLSAFLLEHLPRERKASPHTSDAYAHSFKLLVCFAAARLRVKPFQIEIEQLDVPMILAFLEHVESDRSNTARTRNARLAAIHSFFRFLEYRLACSLDQACRIHAIPMKKADEPLASYLTRDELLALLDGQTAARRRVCATGRCCISPSRRPCVSPNWLPSAWISLTNKHKPAFRSWAKDDASVRFRYGRRRLESSKCGSLFGRKLAIQNCSSTPPGTL